MRFHQSSRGFTLVEIMISMGVALVIIMGSMVAVMNGARWHRAAEANEAITSLTTVVLDTVGRDIQSAGGGALKAWQAIWIENSSDPGAGGALCPARAPLPACNGGDRLSIATTIPRDRICQITASDASSVTLDNLPNCCLSTSPVQVMLLSGLNWSQRRVTGFDSASCVVNIEPGPMAPNDRIVGLADWAGGMLVEVQIGTYHFDRTQTRLFYFDDENGDNVIDAGENLIVADGLFDFQVSLGYDFNVVDGWIREGPVATDEVLFNAVGEMLGAGYFLSALPINLHTIFVGIITGQRGIQSDEETRPARIPDGELIEQNGLVMRAFKGRYMPRHL